MLKTIRVYQGIKQYHTSFGWTSSDNYRSALNSPYFDMIECVYADYNVEDMSIVNTGSEDFSNERYISSKMRWLEVQILSSIGDGTYLDKGMAGVFGATYGNLEPAKKLLTKLYNKMGYSVRIVSLEKVVKSSKYAVYVVVRCRYDGLCLVDVKTENGTYKFNNITISQIQQNLSNIIQPEILNIIMNDLQKKLSM